MDKEIKIDYILQMLKIKRSWFFELLAKYRKDPDNFSIQYNRKTINRKIDPDIEKNIVKALEIEKDLIKAKEVPIRCHNYTYIKDILENDYNQRVSLSTIINRAKANGFCLTKPKQKVHDKEVITNYPGELIWSEPLRLDTLSLTKHAFPRAILCQQPLVFLWRPIA